MFQRTALASTLFAAAVSAQGAGTLTAETHPALPAQKCTASGCTTQNTKVVLDANWRWLHDSSGTNCYTGNEWDTTICPDAETCASACSVDGADYSGTYGITTSGNALTLKFVTEGQYSTNIGSRVYLMKDDTTYQKIPLLNQEFTFDVDVSNLPCGLNGALYFSDMAEDGGLSEFSTNKAGAKYGTGYCDAQCPQDIKFIDGKANVEGWVGSDSDANAGTGNLGTCCSEMDIWEANKISTAYTPHPCSVDGQTACTGTECGAGDDRYKGVCDKDGCDFNSFRMGNTTFYGEGKTIDTGKKFTVVTQFITDDGTASGTLTEIKRKYVQDGVVYENSMSDFEGIDESNSISEQFCEQQKTTFGDENHFKSLGGLARMGERLGEGMVLALSIWDDHAANLLWLDSNYPVDADATKPGIARGECATDSGVPADLEKNSPDSSVTYSNIKWGDLDSTYSA